MVSLHPLLPPQSRHHPVWHVSLQWTLSWLPSLASPVLHSLQHNQWRSFWKQNSGGCHSSAQNLPAAALVESSPLSGPASPARCLPVLAHPRPQLPQLCCSLSPCLPLCPCARPADLMAHLCVFQASSMLFLLRSE